MSRGIRTFLPMCGSPALAPGRSGYHPGQPERHQRFGGRRMGDPTRTAREVVELYNLSVWNERDFDVADELVAEPMIRHEVGSGHALTRDQIRKGIEDFQAQFDKLHWDLN